MFEIFLATHGSFSDGLKNAANLIIGATDNVHTFNLNHGDDVNNLNVEMTKKMAEFGEDKEVLFLTDLANASPYNQSLIAINNLEKENQLNKFVLTGVNLPILIQAISEQLSDSKLSDVIDEISEVGKTGILKWAINALDEEDDF